MRLIQTFMLLAVPCSLMNNPDCQKDSKAIEGMTHRVKAAIHGFLAIAFAVVPVCSHAREKPNVILIMADDIGFECYSHKGSEFYSTPNIDGLARTGVEFTQAYAEPKCTPSRVALMTGRYPFRTYRSFGELDLTQPNFATMVQRHGYATAIAGKWQLSPGNLNGPYQAGFDEYCLWHFSAGHNKERRAKLPELVRDKGSRYASPRLFENGRLRTDTNGRYGPDVVSDFICEFIERKQTQPFLVYYPMILTHSPFQPTPESIDWPTKDPSRPPIQHFQEMVAYMDKMVGKIVAKLETTGLRERTLVIVTGDNGTDKQLSYPFPPRGVVKGGKGTMKDAGNRVAFVANWPGTIEPGTVIDNPICLPDVLPTIAEVSGADLPPTDGQSLLSLMKGETTQHRNWVFQSYGEKRPSQGSSRSFVRDADWKLYADGSLYHVARDWQEVNPITGPEGDNPRRRLQAILDRILQDVSPSP